MWQGVVKAWNTMQTGIEQQDPTTWDEIIRQPLFGNRFLTDEQGMQWGTTPKTNLKFCAEKQITAIKDLVKEDGNGWKPFAELINLRRSITSPYMHNRIIRSIPWQPVPIIPSPKGLWIASKDDNGRISKVYHISNTDQ